MALNLNSEADRLISDYMVREALPSKTAATNRLIILTLGTPQSAPQQAVQVAPSQPVAQPQVAQPPQDFAGKFRLG